ncbi:tyrosine-type recombinase/integrase [Nocardia sp. CA-135398]|uniref:tyrosine-type recombinase/integrase n=1 Tax=Nocardia sp. CA-135398 TaxID=3239977 RepID=UPI003D971A70
MPRQSLAIGTYGAINCKKVGPRQYRARARYRAYNGETVPVEGWGTSKSGAEARLKQVVQDRMEKEGGRRAGAITRDTLMPELADRWLAEMELDETITPQTLQWYREEIEPSNDPRAKKETIKIKSAMSGVRVFEADTSFLDAYLKRIQENGHRRKAQSHKIILTGMMSLAVRHGAIRENPVREVGRIKRKKAKPTAMNEETRHGLRAQLETWLAGKEIPGTPAYTHGPARDRDVLNIADVLLGTGARPGEALAFRRCDLNRRATPWELTICGTIVRVTGKGLYRQEWPKTAAGYRIVVLPQFTVDTLKEMGADKWDPEDESPMFPSRRGGWRDPHNFGRTWRAARGITYAWITPKTYRKTNLTVVAEEFGPEQAKQQAGHRHSSTTQEHYIDKPAKAPDSTAALNHLAPRFSNAARGQR